MLTANVKRKQLTYGQQVVEVDGRPAPEHLAKLRIPPAWTDVAVDPDPSATILATGLDAAGRKCRLYSPEHHAQAKAGKFQRVRALLSEWEDIRTEIESAINDKHTSGKDREAALVAYLIYETGMRPGSTASARGDNSQDEVETFGASTIQLRHVKPCKRGVRLKFVGKKGVRQNVLVTNPYLVRELKRRKAADARWSRPVFDVSAGKVNSYIAGLGGGVYTAKDFRTARGTSLALELLGPRKRLPKAKSRRKRIVNNALDRVAKLLGNTRAISRSAYVDPTILERFLN